MANANRGPANPVGRASVTMDDSWRCWCAENVLLGSSEASMVQAMLNAGVDASTAAAEVRAAANHPYVRAAQKLGAVRAPGGGTLDAKLGKRDWVLECYRRAARQASWHGKVPRVPKLSRQQFLDEYYAQNRPVVMTGAMDDWPALARWTCPELKRRFGERVVSVQANRGGDANYEQNSERLRHEMTFGEYVERVESSGETNDFYITANNSGTNKEALKELWEDIVPFPEYLRDDDPGNRGFFWFGPNGTVTPLHHDLTNNFMAQVRGRKRVRLIAPYELARVYNNRHCYTQVDLDRVDYDRFPLFRDVTVTDVEIGPGDLLFLPVGWWHYVRGLEISITMTFTNFVFDNDFHSFYSTYDAI
jgi:cupin-like protein